MDDNRRRLLVFGMSIVVGLASGSNYVYSAYAPQLGAELHVSSTTVNLIGLAGNLGVYATGPVWGKMVDSKGQRLPLLLGGLSSLLGYSTIRLFLVHTLSLRPSGASPHSLPSNPRLAVLMIAMFLTGSAGSAGLAAAVNATAKSFPDARRASATGAVLAGFGLSAFFFSTLGRTLFAGEAAGLVGLLALGTGLPMVIGSFLIRPVPPAETEAYARVHGHADDSEVPGIIFDSGYRSSEEHSRLRTSTSSRHPNPTFELVRSRSSSTHPPPSTFPAGPQAAPLSRNGSSGPLLQSKGSGRSPAKTEYTPLALLRTPSFYLLALVLAILCGTGLMYINNVGTVALVLARQGRAAYDKKEVSGWQSRNVGVISVWNCLGRIGGGIASDIWKARFNGERVWLLPVVAALFILSQTTALYTTHVESLWIVSSLLGVSYGCLFNVVPMLVLEWFGMANFSQNFGWICVAPVVGGNLFNLLFGWIYDSNSVGRISSPDDEGDAGAAEALATLARRLVGRAEGAHDCLLGVPCYASAFKISLFGCFIALGIAVWLGWTREKRDMREKALLAQNLEEEEGLISDS